MILDFHSPKNWHFLPFIHLKQKSYSGLFQTLKTQNFLETWWRFFSKEMSFSFILWVFQTLNIQKFFHPWWRFLKLDYLRVLLFNHFKPIDAKCLWSLGPVIMWVFNRKYNCIPNSSIFYVNSPAYFLSWKILAHKFWDARSSQFFP